MTSDRSSHWVSNVREIAQTLSSVVIGFTIICFSIGLLIINLHLSRFGIYSTDLIRSEYILTGLLFVFLVVITQSSLLAGFAGFKISVTRWKEKDYFACFLSIIFVPLEFLAPMSVTLALLSGKPFLGESYSWTALGALIMSTGVIYPLMEQVIEFSKNFQKQLSPDFNENRLQSQIYKIVFMLMFSIMGFGIYANYAYPYLSSAVGGGDRGNVMLLATEQGVAVSKSLNLPMETETNLIGPFQLLTETNSEIVIIIESSNEKEYHAVSLQRNMFEAMITAPLSKT